MSGSTFLKKKPRFFLSILRHNWVKFLRNTNDITLRDLINPQKSHYDQLFRLSDYVHRYQIQRKISFSYSQNTRKRHTTFCKLLFIWVPGKTLYTHTHARLTYPLYSFQTFLITAARNGSRAQTNYGTYVGGHLPTELFFFYIYSTRAQNTFDGPYIVI